MRYLVSFIFVSLTAVLLSSCGGGGGGGDGARPSAPPVPVSVGVSFETHVQDATLETTTDTIDERAKRADGSTLVETHIDVVVTDDDVPSSGLSSGGLAGFVLPQGGCKVIEKGVYANYLVSYRQGIDGELECLPSCSGVSRAVVTQGYRILLCVTADEGTAGSLVFKAGECKGGKVVQFDKRGCQAESDCATSGYKVDLGACVAKVGTDCTGTQGLEDGKCITASTAKHCTDRGAFVLNQATTGCQTSGACEGEGYKVVSDACVAKVGTDCTGAQGLEDGKCITASTAKHCTDRGAFVLNQATTGCQTSGACEGEGYKVVSDACVAKVGTDCTGEQGFESGKCVAATTAKHCTDRGAFILNKAKTGCQTATARARDKVESVLVWLRWERIAWATWLSSRACVMASTVKHCTDRGAFILNKAKTGCQTERTSRARVTRSSRMLVWLRWERIAWGTWLASRARCYGFNGKDCTDRGAFILNKATTGSDRKRLHDFRLQGFESNACVAKVAGGLHGRALGFESGKCITATTAKHCTDRGAFVLNQATTGCQTESDCTTSGYKVKSGCLCR